MVASVLSAARNVGGAFRGVAQPTVESPEISTADAIAARRADWEMLDRWYDATRVYSARDWPGWSPYLAAHNLPTWIRAVYNPIPRAVDWYAGHLFRGTWTEDGRPLPDGTPHLLPIPEDILVARPGVVAAAMQGLTWSNFRTILPAFISRDALHGNAFFEINDDTDGEPIRRKVKAEQIPLWQLQDITLNAGGDVKRYVLAFTHRGDDRRYTYRKEVDDQKTLIYHDDRLVETVAHGYGFCPGVWIPFRVRGSQVFGTSLVQGVIPKIDRVNALHAIVEAHVQKSLNQPMVFIGRGQLRRVVPPTERTDARGATHITVEEGTIPLQFFDADNGRVEPLMGALNIADANDRLAALIADIERDLPEITMDQELRTMSSLTGPAADRVMSDVRARYTEVMGNVDAAIVKLMQMLVAIGGHRANNDGWGTELSRQQAKFRINETAPVVAADGTVTWEDSGIPLGLDSYARGALDLALVPRPLVEDILPQNGTEEYERMLQLRVTRVEATEALRTDYGLDEMQVPETDRLQIRTLAGMDALDADRAVVQEG